ncbi:MAG: trehalose-phosphatase [Proteobacteria bacterium]|nr:trehalose-phosphatase [Pseudomonadota bacterium]MBU1595601.1 trehalose-phosphatase [Pseudomonadota bacterium]
MKEWTQLLRSREYRALLAARRKLLMLDYDGTLAPFTAERHKALPYLGVRRLLEGLARNDAWRVVIVSGRSAADVAGFLELERNVEIFGCHGGEHRDLAGLLTRLELAPGLEKALADARFWAEGQGLGEHLEAKHGCLAIHVRGLPPPRAAEIVAEASRVFGLIAHAAKAEVLPFDGGVEIRAGAFTKGRVVQRLLAEETALHGSGFASAYLGDDLTDEDAFQALGQAGLALLVGRKHKPSRAQYLLHPPSDLLEFLQSCLLSGAVSQGAEQGPADKRGADREPGRSGQMRGRLLVVSNRLPVTLKREGDAWTVKAGAGGLVTALAPVLRDRGGLWVGSSGQEGGGDPSAPFAKFSKEAGYGLLPIELTESEHRNYYEGFSNEIIWPLFHDFQSRCNFVPDYWTSYLDVNRKFARTVAQSSRPDDYVWIHDYHLMHVAQFLKEQGTDRRCGFFLHIPFPAPDIFLKLPWRKQVLQALLEHELVGFQTLSDRRNFVRCLRVLFPRTEVWGRGSVVTVGANERSVRIGSFPISIDYAAFARQAARRDTAAAAAKIRAAFPQRKIVLGVDRLDYSKGIPERLQAFRRALIRYPELRGRVSFIQVLVPSREGVGEYQELKNEIEQLVTQINGEFTQPGWVPIHHLYRNLPRAELVANYLAADIAMVTSLRDGMNLVAKEYCASNTPETGALILSEFTGAAAQFQRLGAFLVNPYDIDEVADALNAACQLPVLERKMRMHKLRDNVRRFNISVWVDSFLGAAFSRNLDDFTHQETVQFHEKEPLTPVAY